MKMPLETERCRSLDQHEPTEIAEIWAVRHGEKQHASRQQVRASQSRYEAELELTLDGGFYPPSGGLPSVASTPHFFTTYSPYSYLCIVYLTPSAIAGLQGD